MFLLLFLRIVNCVCQCDVLLPYVPIKTILFYILKKYASLLSHVIIKYTSLLSHMLFNYTHSKYHAILALWENKDSMLVCNAKRMLVMLYMEALCVS